MTSVTLAISGSGGAGAISTGEMLLRIAAGIGFHGMLKKTFSPQIRGGESAAILRLSSRPVATFDNTIDVLVALDWQNFARFADEVPVNDDTLVIENSKAGDRPEHLTDHSRLIRVDGDGIAAAQNADWVNLVFLGLLSRALGADSDRAETIVGQRLKKYSAEVKDAGLRSFRAGFDEAVSTPLAERLGHGLDITPTKDRWLATGNQMAALGALEAGIRFVAAYPITPASDLLEWMSRHIENVGGHLVQAEDELAAINMAIGAGFGGVPAMTATSGPGMALMAEAMGLAVASETPVVIVNVMRGGPSTGIPTKSEQSDFNLAVYGLHGDAPHVVLAASSIEDCYHTTAWAAELATHLQTLVIVLSDQFLGHSLKVFEAPPVTSRKAAFDTASPNGADEYLRYLDTESGISPVAFPGQPGAMYTADGLEHSQNAVPSPRAGEHSRQLNKRERKLLKHDFGDRWADLTGDTDGNPLVICWGSTSGAVSEAIDELHSRGVNAASLAIRLLTPLPLEKIQSIIGRASRILVVEQNHGAQFCHYLRSLLPQFEFNSLALPGPLLITPRQVIDALEVCHEH